MSRPVILAMELDQLRKLDPELVDWWLSPEEILHMVDMTGNYLFLPVPQDGDSFVPKKHVKLKSGRCSNGFINFKKLLKDFPNLRSILARQLAAKLERMFAEGYRRPDWVVGVPDAATELGEEVARLIGAEFLEISKIDKRMVLDLEKARLVREGETILIIEDLCTRGTGVSELILEIISRMESLSRKIEILDYIMYIVNRGVLEGVVVDGVGSFRIEPLAARRIDEYDPGPDTCPFCARGSEPVKAKDPSENWLELKSYERPTA